MSDFYLKQPKQYIVTIVATGVAQDLAPANIQRTQMLIISKGVNPLGIRECDAVGQSAVLTDESFVYTQNQRHSVISAGRISIVGTLGDKVYAVEV